jgi:hypothetical protein
MIPLPRTLSHKVTKTRAPRRVGGRVTLGVVERLAATVATVTSTTTVLGGRSRLKVTDAAAAVVAALGRQSLDLTLAFTGS